MNTLNNPVTEINELELKKKPCGKLQQITKFFDNIPQHITNSYKTNFTQFEPLSQELIKPSHPTTPFDDAQTSQFLCLGLPRTGTKSLTSALQILYPNLKILHGITLTENLTKNDIKCFTSFLKNDFSSFNKYMNQYQIYSDLPFILFSEKIKISSNTIVIYTTRNPDDFAKSWSEYMMLSLNVINKHKSLLSTQCPLFSDAMILFDKCRKYPITQNYNLHDAIFNQDIGKKIYLEYDKQIKTKFSNFLKFNVSDGWGPLCSFLQEKQPNCDFPHVNTLINHKYKINLLPKC